MKIRSIFDDAFSVYGKAVTGYDFSGLLEVLSKQEKPSDRVVYVPSCKELESLPVFSLLQDRYYGGMPIQIGYCNGTNTKLNCLEYHRDSEVNVFESDTVLLVGRQQDIINGIFDTAKTEAFLAPAGSAAEFYATTLHYAPCDGKKGSGFRAAVVLPLGTNTDKPGFKEGNAEDRLLFARNKWLLALPGTAEAASGAYIGLTGGNIDISDSI
jgi:hypothetical protein